MMKVAVFVALFAACLAQPAEVMSTVSSETTTTVGGASVESALVLQLQQEKAVSRGYIETLLKLQSSQLAIQAANEFSTVLVLAPTAAADDDDSVDESSDSDFYSLLEEGSTAQSFIPGYGSAPVYGAGAYGAAPAVNLGYGGFPAYGVQQEPAPVPEHGLKGIYKAKLLGAFQLYYSFKIRFYQTVYRSADVQEEFWNDRAIQLYVQLQGESVAPAILQLLFVKLYRTNLETLKLSLTFQYLSHFVSWLEDELDVNGSMYAGELGGSQKFVEADQVDDLIRDRMFAFAAYNSFAQLDFQTFYFDLYLEAVTSSGSLGGASLGISAGANAQSFVEVESTTKPFTDVLATGSFGAGMNTAPYLFLKVYRFYFLLFQMYAAHSGLTSAYADNGAYAMLTDETTLNDDKGLQFKQFGVQMLYGGFANNLRYSAQMEYVASLYELYLLFVPALSSFGSSLGTSFGSF